MANKVAIATAVAAVLLAIIGFLVLGHRETPTKTVQEVCRSAEYLSVFIWDKRAIDACQPYRDNDPSFHAKQTDFWRQFDAVKPRLKRACWPSGNECGELK